MIRSHGTKSHMLDAASSRGFSKTFLAQRPIGRSEIHQGTGASFEFLLIDKLTPPHERSC